MEKSHKRVLVRGNKKETGTVQSTLNVLPSSGFTEREKLLGCDGCTHPKKNMEDELQLWQWSQSCTTALMAMVPVEVLLRSWQQAVNVTTVC